MPSNKEPLFSKILIKEQSNPQILQNKQSRTPNSPTPSKEKLKIKNKTNSINNCGICSSDEGKLIRGYIDRCDHCFCFICIKEWAKVGSRCPLCKRGFSIICRLKNDGILTTGSIVSVPYNNQVYHHYENVTTGHQDLYAEKQCTVCHNNSNESLLLLCDLCDSASHTYCVGLGDTVPEDDWICRDCTQKKYKQTEDDKDLDADSLSVIDPNSKSQNRLQNHQNVSVADIVREPSFCNMERSSSNRTWSPSTHVRNDGKSIATANVNCKFQAECHAAHSRSQFAARTVQYCRSVDCRIRALGENWDKIRQGSLSFSSFPISKPGQGEVPCGAPCKLNSSSCSNQQAPRKRSSSDSVQPDHATKDIKKAWKMMNNAISIDKKKRTNNIVPCSSKGLKRPLSDTETSKESAGGRSMLLSSRQGGKKDQDCIKFKEQYQDRAAEKHNDKCYPTPYSVDSSKLSTSKMVKYSVQDGMYRETCVNLPPNNSLGTFLNDSNKNHSVSACHGAGPVAENRYATKPNVHASSSCNLEKVTNVEKHYADGIDSDAKSEIQSLVKLNLKVLSTKKKLDTNAFKEVARVATHSILAACGIGPPKPWIRPFQIPNCSHADKVEQVRRSSLMPSSCRECFFVFVKDVVKTIMLEKTS